MFSEIKKLHEQLNVFQKVLTANAVMLIIGASVGTWLAMRTLSGQLPLLSFVTISLIGVTISLLLNFFLLRLAFQPLFQLRSVMEQINAGDYDARAPEFFEDPVVRQLGRTFNQMLDRLAEYRQNLSHKILQALEDERRLIAGELHDNTSQSLSFTLIQLDLLREQLQQEKPFNELERSVNRIAQLTEEALDSIRTMMHNLRPTILDDLGLIPALRWLVRDKMNPMGLHVRVEANGFTKRLPEIIETTIYRICQEALTNTLKHAQATEAVIKLDETDHAIRLEIADDGRGFMLYELGNRFFKNRGLGLISMQERAKLCGGTFDIQSEPGKGTRITVTLPKEVRDT